MEFNFETLLQNADALFGLVAVLVGCIVSIINFFRTGKISKNLGGLTDMVKYRTADSAKTDDAQTFKETIKDYTLDEATNELVELPIEKNVQEYIDSYLDTALERVLERFLPQQNVVEDSDINDYVTYQQDLATAGAIFEKAEEYRDKFGLDDNMSVSDIYKYVGQQATALNEKLKNTNKGVTGDASKETLEKESK